MELLCQQPVNELTRKRCTHRKIFKNSKNVVNPLKLGKTLTINQAINNVIYTA